MRIGDLPRPLPHLPIDAREVGILVVVFLESGAMWCLTREQAVCAYGCVRCFTELS